MGQRILVTGGAGFVGSALCHSLIADGNEVVCLDNFLTSDGHNVADLRGNPHFTLIEQDVTLPIDVEVDAIYNLACPASPIHYQRDPVATIRTCVIGATNVLDLATRRGVPVLQASTSEVYGDPDVHPQVEGYWGNVNPVGPRSCYDEGKRCAESLFLSYQMQYGTQTRIARIFNTYGPGMSIGDGRVVSNFVVQALRGEDITLMGDGTQTRSFCFVDDLVRGLRGLMESGEPGPINLGNPIENTMIELAELVIEITGSKSQMVLRPLPQDDPRRRRPDISLARAKLGWAPAVPLRQGLERTIAYFDKMLATA